MFNLSISAAQLSLPSLDGSSKESMFRNVSGMDSETEVVEFAHTIVSPRDIASGMATGITSPRDLASGLPCHAGATAEGHLPWNLPQPDSKHIIAILIGL